jgi:hypothetical protein
MYSNYHLNEVESGWEEGGVDDEDGRRGRGRGNGKKMMISSEKC